jgi:hypothetical protein
LSASNEATQPPVSPDGNFYWNGSVWVSLISADGTQRWDGKAWRPLHDSSVDAPVPVPVPVPVPAAAPAAGPALDVDNLPSWLSAESAQIFLGGAGALGTPDVVDSAPTPASPRPAAQPPPVSAGGSTWVQQTYRTDGAAAAKPRFSPLVVGGAVFLVLALALGGALAYQQLGSGTAAVALDVAHLSAAGLLTGARTSISSAGSYHLLASSGAATQEITVSGPKDASIDIKSPAGTVSMMLTGGLQFLKAPAIFYADKNPVLAANAADQWIIVPSNESLIPLTSVVNLAKTAECFVGRHGALKKVGPTTIDGRPVVEVDDNGQVPSGTPAHFYFTPDGGQLVGVDVVGASTPGGTDPTCDGGLGIYSPTFSVVQKYRFDHWGATLDVRMPSAIDLSQKPWCGAMVGSGLSAAVRQYLVAANTYNLKVEAIDAAGCGCQFSSWQLFTQAATAEISASDEYSGAVEAIAFQGQAKTDANAIVSAFHTRNGIMRQGLATGTFTGYHSSDAQRAPVEDSIAGSVAKLRFDIGLPPGSSNCGVTLP